MKTIENIKFNQPPRVVIDTNALLVSISSKSASHLLFAELLKGSYYLCLSNEILEEYAEIVARCWNAETSFALVKTLLNLTNVERTEIYFHWNLIWEDADDNKFVDCAVTASAHCIVTNDKHYAILSQIGFPSIRAVSLEEFVQYLTTLKTP